MKTYQALLGAICLTAVVTTFAADNGCGASNCLPEVAIKSPAQIDTIELYIGTLASGNVADMYRVFDTKHAYVMSTSEGRQKAIPFFESFLPTIQRATTRISHIYVMPGKNWYAASFEYHWTKQDGSTGGGHYTDEFHFNRQGKIDQVIMYENLK